MAAEDRVLNVLAKNQTMTLVGETGSGKTTQDVGKGELSLESKCELLVTKATEEVTRIHTASLEKLHLEAIELLEESSSRQQKCIEMLICKVSAMTREVSAMKCEVSEMKGTRTRLQIDSAEVKKLQHLWTHLGTHRFEEFSDYDWSRLFDGED